jgi:hypothetical protein
MVGNLPGCCARTASGHAAAPPRSPTNSHRRISITPSPNGPFPARLLAQSAGPAVHEFERDQDRSKADASAFLFGRKNCHLKLSGAIGILAGGEPGK